MMIEKLLNQLEMNIIFTKMKSSVVLPSLVAVILLAAAAVSGKTHVKIVNLLGEDEIMNIHCRSKDDDLGQHTLSYFQTYEFRFHPNIWMTTLFYCDVSWRYVTNWRFDAYDFSRDGHRCEDDCRWIFMPTEVDFYNSINLTYIPEYPWPPP